MIGNGKHVLACPPGFYYCHADMDKYDKLFTSPCEGLHTLRPNVPMEYGYGSTHFMLMMFKCFFFCQHVDVKEKQRERGCHSKNITLSKIIDHKTFYSLVSDYREPIQKKILKKAQKAMVMKITKNVSYIQCKTFTNVLGDIPSLNVSFCTFNTFTLT